MRFRAHAPISIALLLITIIPPSFQQSADLLPVCSRICIADAIVAAGCIAGDRGCECSRPTTITNDAASCMVESCSSADIATTEQVGQAICSAYSASVASASSSTSAATSGGGVSTVTIIGSAAQSTLKGFTTMTSSTGTSTTDFSSSGGSSPSGVYEAKKGLSTGAKASVAIGAVALGAILALAAFFLLHRRKRDTSVFAEAGRAGVTTSIAPAPPTGLQEVEARSVYTQDSTKRADTYITAMSTISTPDYGTHAIPVVPPMQKQDHNQSFTPYVPHVQELPVSEARIVTVAEADSYVVPYGSHGYSVGADSYAVPQVQELQSHGVGHELGDARVGNGVYEKGEGR